jgi:serine/threonine-protein kinase
MTPDRWQQINNLYQAVLEREVSERKAFLQQVCSDDEELRREVEDLLTHQEIGAQFMGAPALEVAAKVLARTQDRRLIGKQLGPYEVLSLLGVGGMGEVYRARDTRLDRQVAIKVLPDEFSGHPERLARFEREAKVLASLNHPSIAAIYGLEQADGQRFLVLELVEGETLAELLEREALPIETALGICRQIAEGLEAAHEKGVIHRDLKPANVKITPEGKVKILDFGLAKAYQKEGSAPDLSKSPTLTEEMTGSGVILGTAAYMSPEQAMGKPIDKRADIWAFGCLLYECLTGRRAFRGATIAESIAAILKSDPDWQALPAATPWGVKALLYRCLQKDPKERLRDIGDARIEIGESLSQPGPAVSASRRLSMPWIIGWVSFILIAGVLVGVGLMKYGQRTTPTTTARAVIKLEPGHWLEGGNWGWGSDRPIRTAMAISSDGRFIVYSAIRENPGPQANPQLYLRRTDQLEANPILGTEGGINPFLSPDDRWVGFYVDLKLKKVSVEGGVPTTLCDYWALGASWGQDNSIVLSRDKGLYRVPADGGKEEVLTTPDKTNEEMGHRLPHWLPDGKGVLFTIMREFFDLHPRVALLDLKTRKWSVLLEDAADARYVSTGHLVFLRRGTLMAVPFDLGKLRLAGQPVPAVANVMQALNLTSTAANNAAGQYSVSDSGSLVYAVGGIMPDPENTLVWVDQKGNAQPITSRKAPFVAPRLSPDGKRIAYQTFGTESRVWIYDISRGTVSRLTGEGKATWPIWAPDGKRVAFNWCKFGQPNLYWQPADGSQPMERLATSEYTQSPGSFPPDGATLAFMQAHPEKPGWDINLLDLKSRRITSFLNSKSNETYPELSPDGHWIAYVSNESGQDEVYVRSISGPGGKWPISTEGGVEPLWARNGSQLFYRWDNQVWAVDVRTDGGFSPSKPRLLFKVQFGRTAPIRNWDISLDGQRFLMVKGEEPKLQPVTELILVQNWFEELKRLAPTGNK